MEEVASDGRSSSSEPRHGKWTKEEDELLRIAVQDIGERKWRQISVHVPGRSPIQCLHRWTKILRPGLVKGPWTPEEDQQLKDWVEVKGPTKWSHCALKIIGRSGKQCRERWMNTLSPDVKRGEWQVIEDAIILQEFERLGPKWTEIAKALPGRTDNAIKNRFYSNIRKVRPRNILNPSQGACFYYDEDGDPEKIQAEIQIFNLLRHMQKLELLLSNTKQQIGLLEDSIDAEGQEVEE